MLNKILNKLKQRNHKIMKEAIPKHGEFVGGLTPLFHDVLRLLISIIFALIAMGFTSISPSNTFLMTLCLVMGVIALMTAFFQLFKVIPLMFVDMIEATKHLKDLMQ